MTKSTPDDQSRLKRGKNKRTAEPVAAVRLVGDGDVSPSLDANGIATHEIEEATRAAQEAKVQAVRDIVQAASGSDLQSLTKVLQAIMDGASSDDAAVLRKALAVGASNVPKPG
jgi:hypothetical protein